MKVTNISQGSRGINTTSGAVLVEPGQTVDDLDVSDAELKVAKATGWFEFSGDNASGGEKLDRDELKKQADELGLTYPGNISNAKLKEMIDAKLGE